MGEDYTVERDLGGMFGELCKFPAFLEEAKRKEAEIRKRKQDLIIAREQEEIRLRKIREQEIINQQIAYEKEQARLLQIKQDEEKRIRDAQILFEQQQAAIKKENIIREAKERKINEARIEEENRLLQI